VIECQAGTLGRRTGNRIVWKTRRKIGRKTGYRGLAIGHAGGLVGGLV